MFKIVEKRQLSANIFEMKIAAERVARATELIAHCRAKLRKAESDVAKVLEE